MPILLIALIVFPSFARATDWCDLAAADRAECMSPHSPLRAHPGNCPPPEKMRDCELSSANFCQIERYENIGFGYQELADKLSQEIAANPNSPFISIEQFPNRPLIRIEKPIRLPAEKKLIQVGQQDYAVCLVVETVK